MGNGKSKAAPKVIGQAKPVDGNHKTIGSIQKRVETESRAGGAKEATGVERFFGAPLRNQAEIDRITKLWTGDIVKEVEFTIKQFDANNSYRVGGTLTPSVSKAVRSLEKDRRSGLDLVSNELLRQMKGLIPEENRIPKTPAGDVYEQYVTKAKILFTQAKAQMAQALMTKTSAAGRLLSSLKEEEKRYQERLAGFRAGWVIGTAIVSVKQGIERILNDPVLRKAYLEIFSVPVGLIPVVGPLIARVMRAAAIDTNFDIGDFLRELFAEGVGKVMEVMALAAIGAVLPPGTSQALRNVATMGGKIVAKSIGAAGATQLVKNVNKTATELNRTAKNSVNKTISSR